MFESNLDKVCGGRALRSHHHRNISAGNGAPDQQKRHSEKHPKAGFGHDSPRFRAL
jgi:hypothetical protein